jgi:dsDNA-specific endonuclease/ATPase MutS2
MATFLKAKRKSSFRERTCRPLIGPQWIIHGHGTGKLRDGVREFLDSYSRKEKYEFADPTDGGKGVTIVFLKG